jgi:hypothetical protein
MFAFSFSPAVASGIMSAIGRELKAEMSLYRNTEIKVACPLRTQPPTQKETPNINTLKRLVGPAGLTGYSMSLLFSSIFADVLKNAHKSTNSISFKIDRTALTEVCVSNSTRNSVRQVNQFKRPRVVVIHSGSAVWSLLCGCGSFDRLSRPVQ